MNSLDKYIKTRIKLKSFDYKLLAIACNNLSEGVINVNGQVKGPIFLPTKKRKYCILRSPHVDKKSREHFEIIIHKRLIEVYTPISSEINNKLFLNIPIPAGVNIQLY